MAAVSFQQVDSRLMSHPQATNYATSGLASYEFSYESLSLRDTILDLGVRFILNCPPEDISTASRLMFQVEEAQWFYEDFAREQNPALPPLTFQPFTKILYETIPIMTTLCADYNEAISEFKAYKKRIPVRGGVILNDKFNKVLMVRAWKRPAWGFPRGKINKEEDDRACAIREVMEETGFDMTDYLGTSQYCERNLGGKNYRLYLAYGVPESTVFETRTRKEIEEIKWIPLAELRKKSKPFFLVTPFANWIEKVAKEKRGVATKLSQPQSQALKKVLGVSGSSGTPAVHNDEESARQLLGMLKPPAAATDGTALDSAQAGNASVEAAPLANADRQLLLDLLKSSGKRGASSTISAASPDSAPVGAEVESARHILALLKQEIATERVVKAPQSMDPQIAAVESSTPAPDAPVLPPNSMLEQLVSSRKSHPAQRSFKMSSKADVPQNALLNVLKSEGYKRETKLIDLLTPPKPASEGSYTAIDNPLMGLLETQSERNSGVENADLSAPRAIANAGRGEVANPEIARPRTSKPEVSQPESSENSLLALLESPSTSEPVRTEHNPAERPKPPPEPKPQSTRKQPEQREKPRSGPKPRPGPSHSGRAQALSEADASNNGSKSNGSKLTTNEAASNSLLQLLDTGKASVPGVASSAPAPSATSSGKKASSLEEDKPTNKEASESLMQLLDPGRNAAPATSNSSKSREDSAKQEDSNSLLQLLEADTETPVLAQTSSSAQLTSPVAGKPASPTVLSSASDMKTMKNSEVQANTSLLTLLDSTPPPESSSPEPARGDFGRRGSMGLLGILTPFENLRLREGARHRMINVPFNLNQDVPPQNLGATPTDQTVQPNISTSEPTASRPLSAQPLTPEPSAQANTELSASNPLLALLGGPSESASPAESDKPDVAQASTLKNDKQPSSNFSLMDLLRI